ncbi:MAG TPA: 50S ribosomal protein L18 [Herpetosiphon sp.]|uniref:Large ribosomal subunit protein uL18 n=2 Tax=Herpetosiphon TaxID=64 RepID=RL18_HERA2|nr:50S ribosomal protein L18 [Herpetosiphon sp.]A9B427.1 RecName: Full=Large ribosomal subunit protein uL18; AltName: Full=50S ribosomal protein L18 [Herpetosiphon aurantiacus DSM 785]ABX07560.1 ribosomal protein L18 [Herpetosiphon aurantiacus DSM 785]HBW49665.1 50S ribosomal protein L18 [Herpetosiphon sp.]
MSKFTSRELRARRHRRLRGQLSGTPERPRLNVFRSGLNIYAQVIDDLAGHTLVSASTIDTELRGSLGEQRKLEQAHSVGKAVAERARAAGITKVVFDRGGYKYHGRVKAVAEGAREGGLEF